jgi:hypothetical protein
VKKGSIEAPSVSSRGPRAENQHERAITSEAKRDE